jgi:WD40 repeat protein
LKWKLSLDIDVGLPLLSSICHSCSLDGALFAVSNSITVLVWDLVDRRFLHEIQIGQFAKESNIVQLEFIGETNVVAALSSDGNIVFVDVVQSKQIGQLDTRNHLVYSTCLIFPVCVFCSIK